MTRAEVDQFAAETGVTLLCADGFDDAIVGIGRQFTRYFVVYDVDTVLQILMDRDGASDEDAREYFEVNVVGAWVGESTPCFVSTSLD